MKDKQLTVKTEEEVIVTNAAIKATDVLVLLGAGAFAASGGIALYRQYKKKKQEDAIYNFKNNMTDNLRSKGYTEDEIKLAMKMINDSNM